MFNFCIVRMVNIKTYQTESEQIPEEAIKVLANLSKLGAQTMAKFLACMLVSDEYEAILTRWCIR